MTSHKWHAVNGTRGVTRLITNTRGHPAPIPGEFMSQIIAQIDEEGFFNDRKDLEPGSDVRIINGPFAQSIAKIEASDSQGRLAVLLEIMGQAVRANISRSDVEPHSI